MSSFKDTLSFMESATYKSALLRNTDSLETEEHLEEVLAIELLHLEKEFMQCACGVETSAAPYVFNFNPITGKPYGTCNPEA